MSNNAGHPSSDAGYSNLELDLDDLDDIDLITNGTNSTRPANHIPDLARGRLAPGPSANRNAGPSSSALVGSSRQGGSRSTNQPDRAVILDFDTEDDSQDRMQRAPYANQAPPLRVAFNLSTADRAAHMRAMGHPELAELEPPPDETLEGRLNDTSRRNRRLMEMADNRAAARERRREAMAQAIESAPPPRPGVRVTRPTTSAARERAEEAAAARRAAPADPGPTAAQLERRRRVENILREDGDPPLEGYDGALEGALRPRYPWQGGIDDHQVDHRAHFAPPPANNFATQEEHRDALEAVRISRELDRQEMADQRARLIADNARLRAEAPRNGIGAGGAGAWGMNQGAEEAAANDGGWAGGLQALARLGGRVAQYGPFGFEPGGPGGLGERGPNHWMHGILERNRGFHLGPAHALIHLPLPPSIEDAWKGCNYVGHRDPPRSGYTFDFDRENNEAGAEPTDIIRLDTDEDAPWTQELSHRHVEKQHHKPHLVCARCQVPLRVSEGMRNEDDRVYALRCGHVVDAKCLAEMSKPKELVIEPDEVLGEDDAALAPGKRRMEDAADGSTDMVEEDDPNELTTRRKTRQDRAAKLLDEHNKNDDMAGSSTTNNKRKRDRANMRGTEPSASTSTSTAPPAAVPVRPKPPRKPLRGRWGKIATLPPEEFDWDCPVGEKCGRKYKSLKRGGVWMPDPSAAVQLFV